MHRAAQVFVFFSVRHGSQNMRAFGRVHETDFNIVYCARQRLVIMALTSWRLSWCKAKNLRWGYGC